MPAPIKPPFITKLTHGFGSAAYGVKDGGFNYFFLIFYSQVIGLDARLAGLAVTIALVFDAISDPIVGYWSDNFRSRWGRRHPFMYAAAIPVTISFYLLWTPPALSQTALFFYVTILAILIRTFITFYETPSAALIPDLTRDYDERSSFLSFRYFFGWTGGNILTIAAFAFIFPAFATPQLPDGQFNADAYQIYGLIASLLIFFAIIISALGTHPFIKHLSPPPPRRNLTLGKIFQEIFETVADRDFIALFIGLLFGSIAAGLAAAMAIYFLTYFWGFNETQTAIYLSCIFVSAAWGGLLAPYITRRLGKRKGALIIGLIAFACAPLAVTLRLFDLLPENGEPTLFYFLIIFTTVDLALIICFNILAASMIADLVEQIELKTARRNEGVVFAANTFIRKSVNGVGILLAGFILTWAGLEKGASVEETSPETVWKMGAYYVPIILFLWMMMIFAFSKYRITREAHEKNLQALVSARKAD